MRKSVWFVLLAVCAGALCGCPNTAGTMVGSWECKNPIEVGRTKATPDELRNDGRRMKELVFTEDGNFTYTEKRFFPDNADDNAAAFSWVTIYFMTGTYETATYTPNTDYANIVDTAVLMNVTSYQDLDRPDVANGGLITYPLDTYTAVADDPWFLRSYAGSGPFGELMMYWEPTAAVVAAKGFESDDFNNDWMGETYLRVSTE